MMRCAIRPSVTACRCEQIASMWMPATNSVLGSRTGQACITNALKLSRAFSVFTCSSGNSCSRKELLTLVEFFFDVIGGWFIVHSMGHLSLLVSGARPHNPHCPGSRALREPLPKSPGDSRGCFAAVSRPELRHWLCQSGKQSCDALAGDSIIATIGERLKVFRF